MSYKHLLSCLSLTVLTSIPAFAQETPEPEQPVLQLRSITFNGSGCQSPAFPDISVEGNTLKFYALPFVTEIGPDVNAVQNRKNCVMAVDIAVPAGWSYALDSYELHGYMDLDKGIKGELTQTSFFEGVATSGRIAASWTGPRHTDFVVKDKVGLASQQWSPCGLERRLLINTALRLSKVNSQTSPNARGWLQLDEGIYMQQLGFAWKKC